MKPKQTCAPDTHSAGFAADTDAKFVSEEATPIGKRIGVAQGKFDVPDDIDAHSAEIARSFRSGRERRSTDSS